MRRGHRDRHVRIVGERSPAVPPEDHAVSAHSVLRQLRGPYGTHAGGSVDAHAARHRPKDFLVAHRRGLSEHAVNECDHAGGVFDNRLHDIPVACRGKI
ncbi:hypothetical protein D3C80_1063330 [compost metagenome]